jgi:hypothetical protein
VTNFDLEVGEGEGKEQSVTTIMCANSRAARVKKSEAVLYQACKIMVYFLGAFAKLRKAIISFVMPVCLSVRMEQLVSQWTDFDETWCLCFIFKNLSEEFKFH